MHPHPTAHDTSCISVLDVYMNYSSINTVNTSTSIYMRSEKEEDTQHARVLVVVMARAHIRRSGCLP